MLRVFWDVTNFVAHFSFRALPFNFCNSKQHKIIINFYVFLSAVVNLITILCIRRLQLLKLYITFSPWRRKMWFSETSSNIYESTSLQKRAGSNLYHSCLLTYLHTYLLTYLLAPWCRFLLEKLTGLQLIKKFPAFHGTRMFITALTSVRHLSLSWASPIQSIYPHPTSWRSILILYTHLHLVLASGLLPSGFPTKTLYIPSPHP